MRARFVVLALVVWMSGACASVDPQPSFDQIAREVRDRSHLEPSWPRSAADEEAAERTAGELLARQLDAAGASRVALLRNRALLAEIEELGVSQADYAQATRLANPTLSAFRRTPDSGSGINVEIELVQDLLDVLVQPARKRLAAVELEAAKLRLGQTMLDLVADVRLHFYALLAAEQATDRVRVMRDLAAAAAELARRQRGAGNLPEREVALFEADEAQEGIDLLRSELAEREARERLNLLMGLAPTNLDWTTGRTLPPLPASEPELSALESAALERRLDLGAARFGVELVRQALALKKKTRYFPVGVEVGVNREKDLDGTRLRGPQIAIALPIFDTGAASVARLEAELRRAQRQLEQLDLEVRSEVRLFRGELLATRALVEAYRTALIPRRTTVLEQTLLSYNMMLLGVYDLLLARREGTEAELAAIAAVSDYWAARVRLDRAVGGRILSESDLGGGE